MAFDAATWVFAALLALAGVAKLGNPSATGVVLRVANLPSDHRLVRLLGAGEVSLAAAVILIGGRVPVALLAVAYVTFAVFAERQRRHGAGCGCFGEETAPASRLHVVVDAVAATAAVGSAVVGGVPLASVLTDGVIGVVAIALVLLAAATMRLLLVGLPELLAARALHAPTSGTSQ